MHRFCLRYSQYISVSLATVAFISRCRISRVNVNGRRGVQSLEFQESSRWEFSRWEFSGWEFYCVRIFQVGIILGGSCLNRSFGGESYTSGNCPGGNFTGANCPCTFMVTFLHSLFCDYSTLFFINEFSLRNLKPL